MLYAVYERGECDGRIVQATKTYGQPDYGKMLAEHGMPYVGLNLPTLISDADWFVKTSSEELCERPTMQVEASKTRFAVGDCCLITGIPKQARARVTMRDGTEVWPSFVLDADELEISIPVPCAYIVTLDLWPFKTWSIEIEAVAS